MAQPGTCGCGWSGLVVLEKVRHFFVRHPVPLYGGLLVTGILHRHPEDDHALILTDRHASSSSIHADGRKLVVWCEIVIHMCRVAGLDDEESVAFHPAVKDQLTNRNNLRVGTDWEATAQFSGVSRPGGNEEQDQDSNKCFH